MIIRKATLDDIDAIGRLFYDTINTVNTAHYTPRQVEVWSASWNSAEKWTDKIQTQHFFVAQIDDDVAGFASIDDRGYLDYMYVHKNYQGRGVATQLLNTLEQTVAPLNLPEIWAHVSLTARPFFASKGFKITSEFTTRVDDVEFPDCTMAKRLKG